MESHLFVSLEDAINKWMNDHCEDNEWPDAYIYDNQTKDMAQAAALVFDSNVKGQKYLEDNSK